MYVTSHTFVRVVCSDGTFLLSGPGSVARAIATAVTFVHLVITIAEESRWTAETGRSICDVHVGARRTCQGDS